MSNTYKDNKHNRPKHHRKSHPHLMRDRLSVCPYGVKCCGASSAMFSARTVEKRGWQYEVTESLKEAN